jgi:nucleoside-diphosphate-sugar epimerase
MRIFITGVTGFLGSSLASSLTAQGHTVAGSSRRSGDAAFNATDIVIHAAHDFARGAMDSNIERTRASFEAARVCGVRRQIFLSSYSARADAESEYGQTKYRIERIFLDTGETVLRLGLVIGNGGLFARQRKALLRTPVIPIVGGGLLPTAVIAIQHFLDATVAVLMSGKPGEYGLFYDERPTLREFIRAIKADAHQPFVFLPLPAGIAMALGRAARMLRLDLPVDPDQIKALSRNSTAPWRSDLSKLLPGRDAEFCLDYALRQLNRLPKVL